ncbi:hypothetical protein QCA50_002133 [Cerrena zonata]|uniref:Uncharacterized protein n=1 Tax=Cerrena zonata TaxID=2478898 RepID=A0AAW0GYE6_9APHY
MPGQSHKPPSRLIEEALHIPTREEEEEHAAQERAATKIQRAWRTKKHAELLNTDFLWSDVLMHARFQVGRDAASGQRNSPKDRWKRAVFLLNRLEDGNQMLATTGVENEDAARKHLETQHWLELIDG